MFDGPAPSNVRIGISSCWVGLRWAFDIGGKWFRITLLVSIVHGLRWNGSLMWLLINNYPGLRNHKLIFLIFQA